MASPSQPAEPLLLLPGLAEDARLYWHQIITLSARRMVSVAHLGLYPRIEDMAQAILAEAPARFALVGHGLGASVAAEMLRQAPERLTRIALLSINPLAEPPAVAAAREPRLARARAGRLAEAILQEVPAESLGLRGEALAQVQAMQQDMAEALGVEAYVAQSRALMRRPDQQRLLRQARLPALILCGQADRICPLRRHEILAETMPMARFLALEGAGHLPPLEAPEAVTEALAAWLDLPPAQLAPNPTTPEAATEAAAKDPA